MLFQIVSAAVRDRVDVNAAALVRPEPNVNDLDPADSPHILKMLRAPPDLAQRYGCELARGHGPTIAEQRQMPHGLRAVVTHALRRPRLLEQHARLRPCDLALRGLANSDHLAPRKSVVSTIWRLQPRHRYSVRRAWSGPVQLTSRREIERQPPASHAQDFGDAGGGGGSIRAGMMRPKMSSWLNAHLRGGRAGRSAAGQ